MLVKGAICVIIGLCMSYRKFYIDDNIIDDAQFLKKSVSLWNNYAFPLFSIISYSVIYTLEFYLMSPSIYLK